MSYQPPVWFIPENSAAPCSLCGGQGCEEGCGDCQMVHAGPDSHKVCTRCGGSGRVVDAEREQTVNLELKLLVYGRNKHVQNTIAEVERNMKLIFGKNVKVTRK